MKLFNYFAECRDVALPLLDGVDVGDLPQQKVNSLLSAITLWPDIVEKHKRAPLRRFLDSVSEREDAATFPLLKDLLAKYSG